MDTTEAIILGISSIVMVESKEQPCSWEQTPVNRWTWSSLEFIIKQRIHVHKDEFTEDPHASGLMS